MAYIQALAGFLTFVLIAYLFSSYKKAIDWKLVITGLVLQVMFSLVLTKVPIFVDVFLLLSKCFVKLLDFSLYGAQFLFGDLAKNSQSFSNVKHNIGFIFAFQVLPTIIFFSTITSGLYYLGVLQKIVYSMAWLMSKTMPIFGSESLSAAGNIFLGQTEAPLLVKPFIPNMPRSEMLCLMTGGMATIAGGVMAAYISFLGGDTHEGRVIFAAHLLTASIMNAPAGIVFAKILIPETEQIAQTLN
jgi:CNT family concentrative nucleoside transporter